MGKPEDTAKSECQYQLKKIRWWSGQGSSLGGMFTRTHWHSQSSWQNAETCSYWLVLVATLSPECSHTAPTPLQMPSDLQIIQQLELLSSSGSLHALLVDAIGLLVVKYFQSYPCPGSYFHLIETYSLFLYNTVSSIFLWGSTITTSYIFPWCLGSWVWAHNLSLAN